MTALILAGGASRRMNGLDKAMLKCGSITILERKIADLAELADRVIVVAGTSEAEERYRSYGVTVVQDEHPDAGPLAAIHTGLKASGESMNLVVSADSPYLEPALVRAMVYNFADFDVLVPRWDGRLQPLVALYARNCLEAIGRNLSEGRIRSFYPEVHLRVFGQDEVAEHDPEGRSFININTPEDFTAFCDDEPNR